MNTVGFATTFSLVDLLDELPLPKAINIREHDNLATENPEYQNLQELHNVAAIIAPAIQMARLPSDLDRLRFKNPDYVPAPGVRTHHAQASPLMSLIVNHHQQFNNVISAPTYNVPPVVAQSPTIPQVACQPTQAPVTYPLQQQPSPQLQQQQPSPQLPQQQQQQQQPPPPPPPQQQKPPQQLPQQPQHHHHHHQQPPQQPQQPHHHQQQPPPQQQQLQHHHHHQQQQQQPYAPQPQMAHVPQPQIAPAAHPLVAHAPHPQVAHPIQQVPIPRPQLPIPVPHVHVPLPQPHKTTPQQQSRAQSGQVPKSSHHHHHANAQPTPKRKVEHNRQKKSMKSELVESRDTTSEEALEKFLQDLVSEQLGNTLFNFSSSQLTKIVDLTARLKKRNRTKSVNLNKLTLLMTTLSSQLQVQTEVLKTEANFDANESGDESEQNGTSDQAKMKKFNTCCDCAVTALNIMTSNGMDSRVYLEECVEAIINFINIALTIITDTATRNHCSSPKKSKYSSDKKSSKRLVFSKQNLSKLNAKCSEILALVHELLQCRTEATLTDSLVLSTSRAALTAFFLMDPTTSSNELQLNALNVITAIFASYKNHQAVILEELIYSIGRLPTTKRGRIPFQIGSDNRESISIFSALIMKVIQSLFTIRRNTLTEDKQTSSHQGSENNGGDINDFERVLKSQYVSALRASYAFVSSFLRRCCGVDKKDDCDYRVLFETFVEDLMTCLYKPGWSSAQLITHVLIKLLISNINPQPGKKNQQATNQTLKLASLEHLGTICARLIKEKNNLPKCKKEVKKALKTIDLSSLYLIHGKEYKSKRLQIKTLRKDISSGSETDTDTEADGEGDNEEVDENAQDVERFSESTDQHKIISRSDEQKFWLALLTFCQREKVTGKNILCAIWFKEMERRAKHQYELNNPTSMDEASISDDEESNGTQSFSGNNIRQYSRVTNEENQPTTNGPSVEDIQAGLVRDYFKILRLSQKIAANKSRDGGSIENVDNDATIDEMTASNIIKILDVSLPTTQKLIDASLSHIVAALSSTANTNIRSRAMKSLSHVLNDAPKDCAARLLTRDDLQKAIGASLLDQSTSVRESTVELIGRFILNSQSEALIDKYYDMLTSRIMDSGVSVRKRVIKILREICITYPEYPRVPEICSIIIKRINDEGEGIRKLVSETFTQMWFKEEKTHEAIVTKVACITHVVATVWSKILAEASNKNSGAESHFEWLHQLLHSLLKVKENSDDQANHVAKRRSKAPESEANEDGEVIPPEVVNVRQTLAASTQIIAVLMSEKLSNGSQESTTRADCLAAMTTLWSFAKISPLLLVQYLELFQSFLNVEPKSSFDLLILEKVIQIIELTLPSISNPSATTMNSIETNLGKLIIRGYIRVIAVSVSCLSELIHRHTRNYQLSNDMFKRFLKIIRQCRANPNSFEANYQSYLLRALYTCGLLAKHFNTEDRECLYSELVHFVEIGINNMRSLAYSDTLNDVTKNQDDRVLLRSLEGLGFMFERSPSLMLRESTIRIYRFFMSRAVDLGPDDNPASSICVITNMRNYLQDEVTQEIKSASSIDWSRENLKEMTSSKQEDANSTQSSVIQLYLRDMLSCALSASPEIRKASIKLIHSVHNGGHINPLSIVPSLIALSSDDDSTIRVRADHILQEIERKYNNFVNMKSKQGVLESFILNRRKRGFHRLDTDKQQSSYRNGSDVSSNDQNADSQSASNDQNINITAKLSNLYSIVATNRQQRRAFINALLRYFDFQTLRSTPNMLSSDQNESKLVLSKCIGSDILQYVCDNLMFLPFNLLDEPFFLIHQIGITMSNLVSQAVSQFREILQLSSIEDDEVEDEDNIEINDEELSDDSTEAEITDEEEDEDERRKRKLAEKQERLRQRKLELRQRKLQQKGLEQNLINALQAQDNNNEIDDLPVSILQVTDLVFSLHRCILLMHLKRVVWDLYGITDQKFEDYTPNESTKITDKPTHRRSLDEQTCESLIKMPQTTFHFDSSPFLTKMYSDIFGFEDNPIILNQLEQCAPNRQKLKLEYKRFSQLMTK